MSTDAAGRCDMGVTRRRLAGMGGWWGMVADGLHDASTARVAKGLVELEGRFAI